MKVGFVMVAYGLANEITNLFESSQRSLRNARFASEYHLFLHSQKPDVAAACEQIAGYEWVNYYPYGTNRGLAKSWNEGMLEAFTRGCDTVIIVNDDVVFDAPDVPMMVMHAYLARKQNHIVTCMGWHERHKTRMDMGYSCFAINPIALEKIGMFDENIFPIYHEDCDYAYRTKLAGLEEGHCLYTQVRHGGSMTINTDPVLEAQHHQTFVRNEQYYMKKWGGKPHEEKYLTPFNQAQFGVKIAPENRHQPYGVGFDRTDFEIVKV